MIRLGLRLAFSGGWARPVLLACCTAVVSGLLLVAIAVLSLPAEPHEQLFAVVADPGTRGGYAFATALIGLPPLLLLHQAVRLGTAARERRLAALRLAGATPGEVRAVGAVDVGLPALAGAVGGIGFYALLRWILGGGLSWTHSEDGFAVTESLRFVPTSVVPAWWEVVAVVAGVTVLGVAVGLWAGRGVAVTPLGVVRRAASRPPRPWGAVPLVVGLLVGALYVLLFGSASHLGTTAAALVAVALCVVGMVALAPWTAYVVGGAVARRATSAPVLLAARRLVADPRPAARAAAAVGGIGLVAGGASAFLAGLLSADWDVDSMHYVSLVLVGGALLVALLVVVGSLAVHSVEALLDHKRSVAAMAALGAPPDLLARTQRWESGLVALPMSLAGVVVGAVVLTVADPSVSGGWATVCGVGTLLVVGGLVLAAVRAAVRLVRPWSLRAADPAHLRTE